MKKLHSISLQGIGGVPVQIEVDIQRGLPGFSIVGLGDTSIQESRERIRSAIKNSGCKYPKDRITCNLAPAHVRKTGSHFDLPIALGILLEDNNEESIDITNLLASTLIVGEVALSGEVRKIVGALPIVISALQGSWKRILIPAENIKEVHELSGIQIIPVNTLLDAYNYLKNPLEIPKIPSFNTLPTSKNSESKDILPFIQFESIQGQEGAKRALIIAAAGGHNILMEGPPGSGKSMLANALSGILPPLEMNERLEVAQIYSSIGALDDISNIGRPFRKVHPSASHTSILGGGRTAKPGEISLAHRGVLFFDEFLEFEKATIESLREPLESKMIQISRVYGKYTYPADFMFIGAMNPCPCGYLGDSNKICIDTKKEIESYRSKLSGPILDRIDLHIRVPRTNPTKKGIQTGITTSIASKQVATARQNSIKRGGKINSALTVDETENLILDTQANTLIHQAVQGLGLSMRSYHRILRVARTIADIENSEIITENHMAEAMGYRL